MEGDNLKVENTEKGVDTVGKKVRWKWLLQGNPESFNQIS